MTKRVKYPLTDAAKRVAKILVEAWTQGILPQDFLVTFNFGKKGVNFLFRRDEKPTENLPEVDLDWADMAAVKELGVYKLIHYENVQDRDTSSRIQILLLQELRNAVANNFDVSDYFLTLNAVGTIVYGNLEVGEGGNFQSGVATSGATLTQNTGLLVTELEQLVGVEALKDEQLQDALTALRSSENEPKESRIRKMGKVVEELGRCLGHVNNAAAVIQAIRMLVNFMGAL